MILKLFKYRSFFSVAIFIFLFIITLPYYRYNFDVDGVGPMTMALRIYNFDWIRGVNGVWSPLNSWIAAFIPGLVSDPVLIFKLINALCSIIIILLFHGLSNQIISVGQKKQQLILVAVSAIVPLILVSYTHYQLAGDVLQLSIVLFYLYFIFTKKVFTSTTMSAATGVIIALACYAKAFNLPFLVISHFIICIFTLQENNERHYLQLARSLLISYAVLFLLLFPWILLMHYKYGVWAFSTVQTFNFNWLLNEQSYTTLKSSDLLMIPPYADSPTSWEDPYIYFDYSHSGPFDRWANFLHFLKNIFHNVKILFGALNQLSFLSVPILVYYSLKTLLKKENSLKIKILLFVSIFIAMGYTLIYIESRYIWLTGIIVLLMGSKFIIEQLADKLDAKKLCLVTTIFLLSFMIYPADYLQDLRYVGKDIVQTASFLQLHKLNKNFTAIASTASEGSFCDQLAFILKGRYFRISKPYYNNQELIQSCKNHNIQFLIYFYQSKNEKELIRFSEFEKQSVKKIELPEKNACIFVF